MPTPEEILNGLAFAANKFYLLGIVWHIIVLAVAILLISGKTMNKKVIASGSGILLLSVGYISVQVSNPFNAIMFALAALVVGIFTLRFKKEQVGLKWDFVSIIGLFMLIFGFIYPHFLDNAPFYKYLYASPLGLIPCPTLSAVIGITLMMHGFESRKWMIVIALFGLFYGIVGVLRLKVYLDIPLIAGALFLLVYAFMQKQSPAAVKSRL